MHTVPRVALTFLFLQSVASTVAWACSCMPIEETPTELLDAHAIVFVGEVRDGPHRRGCGLPSSADRVTYTVEVTEAFKGVAHGDEVVVETAISGSSCGVEMVAGESRLVYTNEGDVGLCDPGGLAADNADAIDELRAATAP